MNVMLKMPDYCKDCPYNAFIADETIIYADFGIVDMTFDLKCKNTKICDRIWRKAHEDMGRAIDASANRQTT